MRILALLKSLWQSVCVSSLKTPLCASDLTTLKMSNIEQQKSCACAAILGLIS